MKKALLMAAMACVASMPAMAADKMDPVKSGQMADAWFSKIDTNGDGMISKEEHTAFSDSMFTKADTNGDGNISKDEMRAEKMKEHADMKDKMSMKSGMPSDAKPKM